MLGIFCKKPSNILEGISSHFGRLFQKSYLSVSLQCGNLSNCEAKFFILGRCSWESEQRFLQEELSLGLFQRCNLQTRKKEHLLV
ncbi:hypothetical protein SUGI_0182750 [Cryptomeria japonica]|nr:hypothetical protein SUGI_0182750 [Cryptomeria japonica]